MELEFANDEIEIDLVEVIKYLFKKAWLIAAAAILCAGLVVVYGKFMVTPMYESKASIVVMNQAYEAGSDGYLSKGTELTDDYELLVSSRLVVEQVIVNLGLGMTYEELSGSIVVEIPEETRMIDIMVKHEDAAMAQKIAGEMQKVAIKELTDVMEAYAAKPVGNANLPTTAGGFSTMKYAVLAFCGGAALVVVALVVLFLLDGSIKTGEQVKLYLKTVALGQVSVKNKDEQAYEVLAANIEASRDDLKSVVFVGSKEGEGTEKIAYELACTLAEKDRKVLFMDVNLREGKAEDNGLGTIKDGKKSLQNICKKSGKDNLWTIAASKCEKPGALLDSDAFKKLLKDAKEEYDFVVISTPAMEKYIDAAMVAKRCDGAVVVVEAGKTHYQQVQKTMQQLAYVDADILGCVIGK